MSNSTFIVIMFIRFLDDSNSRRKIEGVKEILEHNQVGLIKYLKVYMYEMYSRYSSIVNHSQRLFEHIMHVGVDTYQLEEKIIL